MKWFKHFTDNHRGKSVQYLLDELSYFGPFFKDTILEMCAEKLDRKTDRELAEVDCVFVFHRRVVESATRAKRSTVVRALDAGQTANFWSYKVDGEYFEISAPILLDLFEYDQKKSRQRRAEVAPGKRLDQNRIEKNRIESESSNELSSTTANKLPEVVQRKAKKQSISKELRPASEGELINGIPEATKARWFKLYPDEVFIRREVLDCFGWYENNPERQPKTVRGWVAAMSTWFRRSWPKHTKTIPANKPTGYTESQMADIMGGRR